MRCGGCGRRSLWDGVPGYLAYTLAMSRTVTVGQGDCLSSLARRYGFRDWRTIYFHPDNARLRDKRSDPNHLLPGDRVAIPDKQPGLIPRATGARHTFVVTSGPTRVRLRLEQLDPKRYRLTVGRSVFEGTGSVIDHTVDPSDGNGLLEIWLDATTEEPQVTWVLSLGHMDPHDERSGVRARLNNLGFIDPDMPAAVRSFQRRYGFEPTGEVDAVLFQQLRQVHDTER